MRIVYAGLLGVAQNLLAIIKNIDFIKNDVELHIYGDGNQRKEIENYIAFNDTNVIYHGELSPKDIQEALLKYDCALVPLSASIKGAVPSKIYELMSLGIPVLFCGTGEAADIIRKCHLGLISAPHNYADLEANIQTFRNMSIQKRKVISDRSKEISRQYFDFDKQMSECFKFIEKTAGRK